MSHSVRVNNFMQMQKKPGVDCLSKIFITLQWLLGLNRTRVLCKNVFINLFSVLYVLFFTTLIFYKTINSAIVVQANIVETVKLTQYIFCCFLGIVSLRRIESYYNQLKKFDSEVSCRTTVNREAIVILLSMTAISLSIILVFNKIELMAFIPLHTIHIIENHYYGYLFILLNQRLRLINYSVESSLGNKADSAVDTKVEASALFKNENTKFEVTMNKLMDYYYIIIDAYNLLTDAIKWQLLFIVTSSFIYTLCISYHIALNVLCRYSQDKIQHTVFDIILVVSEMLPVITPCVCCDMVRYEVRRLRELLASKLFESKLDKTNRSIARALLTLTKSRNLSFSLLRMVEVSISLPFSLLGLLATYLIILLQFEKVINPDELVPTNSS